jgi:urate oxidase
MVQFSIRPARERPAVNLAEINQLSPERFLESFGRVLEHSPRYAERAATQRPFLSFEDLHRAFVRAIQADTPEAQLELIRAHPDLAGKAAIAGELTRESASEQASAGLNRLTPEEFAEFTRVNLAYRSKFEMPYIVCVREHTKASILAGAVERLEHDLPTEHAKTLEEIGKIARLRLRDLVEDGMDTNAAKSRIVLGQNNYGKADVRLFKVFRDQARHEVKDVWVDVAMIGDFTAAHTQGNNTDLLATDTVRNTVYALAKDGLTSSIEEFGKHLVRHFVQAGPRISSVRVKMTEHRWDRISVAGPTGDHLEHDHSFTRDVGKHTAVVEGDGSSFTVTSGIDELFILKTTNSGWEGFLREQYTTLPDTNDRILATVVTAHWHYNRSEIDSEIDYDQVWAGVWQQILTTFTDHYSPSMQATLYQMGKAVLERFPEIEKIHFSFPNKHHIKYNLERFGMENDNTIFHADAEPHGLIEGWVERAE